jgi:hypothetical protein
MSKAQQVYEALLDYAVKLCRVCEQETRHFPTEAKGYPSEYLLVCADCRSENWFCDKDIWSLIKEG